MSEDSLRYSELKPAGSRIRVALFIALVGALGWFLFAERWIGVRPDGDNVTRVGTYLSLAACTRDVQKTGGWCGKGCRVYGGTVADCIPLLSIPKKGYPSRHNPDQGSSPHNPDPRPGK